MSLTRRHFLEASATAAASAALLGPSALAAGKPNVIVILHDALRADKLGPYGYAVRPTTPNFTRFAARSTLFENAVSQCAWTIPSVASLFTGVDPQAHKVLRQKKEGENIEMDTMSLDLDTIAERFKAAGYSTAGLIKSPVLGASAGYSQGFDSYEVVPGPDAHRESAQQLTDAALAWLGAHKAGPFYLYLHYMDAHSPYIAPPPFYNKYKGDYQGSLTGAHKEIEPFIKGEKKPSDADLRYLLGLYDEEIEYWDSQFGRLMQGLVGQGLDDNTIVVVTADHGEAFGEHGQFFHGHLYQENIHVPLVVKAPGIGGQRLAHRVEMTDIGATVCALAGVAPGPRWTSVSQAEAIRGKAAPVRPVYSEYMNHQMIIDPKGLKLIRWGGKPELYDLVADPGEKTNLAASRAADVKRLGALIDTRAAAAKKLGEGVSSTTSATLSDEQKEALRALGYVE